jgi:hypothetical protein
MLKIQDYADSQTSDTQIIQHQATFVVGDSLNHLGVHSWLKSKAQHFDRGGNFDVLATDDEIQYAGR